MPRWEHEVSVCAAYTGLVVLRCRCGWKSEVLALPTVSALTQAAQDHRRTEEEKT